MKFLSLKKGESGKYITRYDIRYLTEDNREKNYEIISRDKNIKDFDSLHNRKPDSVVLIIYNEEMDKILLNREYRMAVGEWVYNFPAGLIDEGETPYEAAERELKEETGLTLCAVDDFIGESYSAVGFSNEKNVCVVGRAKGEFALSDSTFEEIEPGWYTKEEVRELLKEYKFAARTQGYCYAWSRNQ